MPNPGLLNPEPLQQATADLYLHRRHSGTDLNYCDIEWFALEKNRNHSAVTPQETDPDLLVSVQESPVEALVGGTGKGVVLIV